MPDGTSAGIAAGISAGISDYLAIVTNAYRGYFNYLATEITTPGPHNYFYALWAISLFFFLLEQLFPWHRRQHRIRKDFWLDGFYMFFNFFIFPLLLFEALSGVAARTFRDVLSLLDIRWQPVILLNQWPPWGQWLVMFLVRDFIHFNIHRLLHRSERLWRFHRLHHSVAQMGFAAHLRYHWMETLVYRSLEFIPLGILGFGVEEFFVVHVTALFIGHFNHSNLGVSLGPLGYIFNNPRMHIWHHVRDLPPEFPYGCNYGISLSLWDYLFKTNYIPRSGRDIPLGFPGDQSFPGRFVRQVLYPWLK